MSAITANNGCTSRAIQPLNSYSASRSRGCHVESHPKHLLPFNSDLELLLGTPYRICMQRSHLSLTTKRRAAYPSVAGLASFCKARRVSTRDSS